jgi:hypothetical protein
LKNTPPIPVTVDMTLYYSTRNSRPRLFLRVLKV